MTVRAAQHASRAARSPHREPLANASAPRWWLWPREHGSYPQLALPMVTALLIGSLRWASALLFVAAWCALFAHEPALVLLGHRGRKAQQSAGPSARRMLALLAAVGVPAAGLGLAWAPATTALAALVPVLLALCLVPQIARRREQQTPGLLLAALSLSSASLPVALAGGALLSAAVTSTAVWALSYAVATLAVRYVIDQPRERRAATAARPARVALSVWVVALGGNLALVYLAARGVMSWSAATAALPVCVLSLALILRPARPQRLRTVGWMLASASVLTLTLLVVGLR